MEDAKKAIGIPENIQQICKDLVKVAQENGLHELNASFQPPIELGWNGEVSFSWRRGRHNEEVNEIEISSRFFVHTHVKD
jgi:hypothetical protein